MNLLDPLFGSKAVDAIFTDDVRLQRMLDFEAALARAEAQLDIALGDYTGGLAEGRLVRGDNPVLMTMELVLEVLA